MQCNELEQILEQHSDGPLPELANSHMNGCEACRALAADLEAIHIVAAGLGAEEIAPPEHIWITLRNQLEAEGIGPGGSEREAWLVVCVPTPGAGRGISVLCTRRGRDDQHPGQLDADGSASDGTSGTP